ncbi:hypothetical protein NC652_024464 [Populus alba x Populus x berolinensis]|nr:hypothetical protein NC652_024464 [Populus alba x Populus x berolinensis]
MQASDRFNINSQLEHLQAKYVGTGHADLNRLDEKFHEVVDALVVLLWLPYEHYIHGIAWEHANIPAAGNPYVCENQKMLLPCGLPPEREDD